MSYKPISENFEEDLLRRKEFYSLKGTTPSFRDINDILAGKYLKMHSHQLFVRNFMNPDTQYKRLHLLHQMGCHAAGTQVLMYDGSVKKVEDINREDILMGDDSSPRRVLNTFSDVQQMVKLRTEGAEYIFNLDHILSLYDTTEDKFINISIREYLTKPREYGRYQVYYRSVEFASGIASLENRLHMLAEIIDTQFGANSHEIYELKFHDIEAAARTCQLAKWCGFLATIADRGSKQYIVTFNDCAELLAPYRKSEPLVILEDKTSPIKYSRDGGSIYRFQPFGLALDSTSVYYGFALDGNHKFLLADCFVAHNTGKSLAAVAIAEEFRRVYIKMYTSMQATLGTARRNQIELDRATPTIFVLGFGATKNAFIRELLKYPEFGFINITEREELTRRLKAASSGLPDDIKNYKDYYSLLKKRITNKTKGGFYRFYGYDEFVNRLFISDEIKLTNLEKIAMQKLREDPASTLTLEELIYQNIENGNIKVNKSLLDQFKNSLIICDEIHHCYNMNMKNNRGVALQFLIDSVESLRVLTLSGTPINNSPTEVCELISFMNASGSETNPTFKVTKHDLFVNNRELRSGALKRIGELLHGHVSFLQDANIKYFPVRVFEGSEFILPTSIEGFSKGSPVPYLKFVQCEMSEFHQRTYNALIKNAIENKASTIVEPASVPAEEQVEEELEEIYEQRSKYLYHNIPTDGYSIYDIVFPNPDFTPGDPNEIGLFRSSEVKTKINAAPQEWRQSVGINIKKFSSHNDIINGDFLRLENLRKYSAKDAKMIEIILDVIKSSYGDPDKCRKIMVYHDRVKMSGVLLIQEILRANGILDEYSEPVDSTICCMCGLAMREHTGIAPRAKAKEKLISRHTVDIDVEVAQDIEEAEEEEVAAKQGSGIDDNDNANTIKSHPFMATRLVIAHSDIDKSIMDQSLTKYNMHDNAHGHHYMILVGSKIIKEGYDFKDIQEMIIVSLPTNIPTLLQVLARAIRKNSHINLPLEQRRVNVSILAHIVNKSVPYIDETGISPEIYRYIDKLLDYIVIQNIEREINSRAIDSDIHRDIIMPPELLKQYFPNGYSLGAKPVDGLGNLYFEPTYKIPDLTLEELNMSTFTAYKYYEEEIRLISYIIKRLFTQQSVWDYMSLWEAVRHPPFGVEVNPALFNERNFIIAFNTLVEQGTEIIDLAEVSARKNGSININNQPEAILIDKLFDINDRFIYHGGWKYKIKQIDKYYILFPVAKWNMNAINAIYMEYIEQIRDRDRAMIRELSGIEEHTIADVETYLRPMAGNDITTININRYVAESHSNINYISMRDKMIREYGDVDSDDNRMYDFMMEFSAIYQFLFLQEAIMHIVGGGSGIKDTNKPKHLYNTIINLFAKFAALITLEEIRRYKDILKQFKQGLPKVADSTPMGYITAKSVRLYDPAGGNWFEVSKIALNKHISYKENDIVIGYFESGLDNTKFKVRKPMQTIREDVVRETAVRKITKTAEEGLGMRKSAVSDTRFVERGIVCGTKNKGELLQIIRDLGISTKSPGKNQDHKIRSLCDIIRNELIKREIKERAKEASRVKWFYGFWEELPGFNV